MQPGVAAAPSADTQRAPPAPAKSLSKRRNRRTPPRCQVLNCTAELATAYCRKRHCCTYHMKADAVRRRGHGDVLWRFCFQCGRLEPLSEFEGNKRSCVQRLVKRLKPSTLAARAAALTKAPSSSSSDPAPASSPQQQDEEADEAAGGAAAQHAQPWLQYEGEQLWPQLLQQCSISNSGRSCPPGHTSSGSMTASTALLPSEVTSAGPLPFGCGSPAVSTSLGGSSSGWGPHAVSEQARVTMPRTEACHAGMALSLCGGFAFQHEQQQQQVQLGPMLQQPPRPPPQQQVLQPPPGCSSHCDPCNSYVPAADAYTAADSSASGWQAPAAPATAQQATAEQPRGWAGSGHVPAPPGATASNGCHGGISDAQMRYLEHKFAAMQAQLEYTDALQDALASLGPAEAASITHAVIHGSRLAA